MLKKAALGVGIATFALSGVASAEVVRPAAVTLQPAGTLLGAPLPAPAKLRVNKRNELAPLVIVIIIAVTLGTTIGTVISVTSGSPS